MAKKMAPWDELTHFDTPIETGFTSVGGGTLIVPYDPRRVVLVISYGAQSPIHITTNSKVTALQGIAVSSSIAPLVFTHKDHPGLCQAAWFNADNIPAMAFLTTIQVILHDWPREGDNGEQSANNGALQMPGRGIIVDTTPSGPSDEVPGVWP